MHLIPIPAFNDNYIWMLHDGERALVVDPGEASGVRQTLERLGLRLDTILITHHHADHTGGVPELREATGARVIGPAFETMPEPLARVSESCIWPGVPSNRRPQPPENSVSPQNTSGCPSSAAQK
jgi:hydroxyacylglutathione hydrolase